MAKAINWPSEFRDEVIQESTEKRCCAFRLGRLYFDNHYWVDEEVIDIRVNHKLTRKAIITGPMKCCLISALDQTDYQAQKASLNSIEAVIAYLSTTYNQLVTPETEITVVYYTNQPLDPAIMEIEDDPHAVL